jgi:hypothetical protein
MGLAQSIHTDPIVYYHATDKMFHEMRAQREMTEVMAEEDGLFLSVMHRDQVKHREAQLKHEKELKLELNLAKKRIEELQNLLPGKKLINAVQKQDDPPSYDVAVLQDTSKD